MSRAECLLPLAISLVLLAGCGTSAGPTAPTSAAVETSARATESSVSPMGVTGQMIAGRFNYWVRFGVAAGSKDIVITRIDFRYPERAQAPPFTGLDFVTMNRPVPPGGSYVHETELISPVAVSELAVTVSYTDGAGQQGQLRASTAMPAIVQGEPSLALSLEAFTVTGFMEGTTYAYWPKLTLRASDGSGAVTVTRILFDLGRSLVEGSSNLSIRQAFRIPAGSALQLFHNESYGEPDFYLTSSRKADEVSVRISYVDDAGRGADIVAVAPVVR